MKQVTEHVYGVESGDLTAYLIVLPEGVTLVDAGFPGIMPILEEALRELGRQTADLRDVLVTHCHPDHAGGLAEIKRATGATAWMHPADAELVRRGQAFRSYHPAPGEESRLFVEEVIKKGPQTFEPAEVEREVASGEVIPVAGGITAIGTPGHSQGHLCFLWPADGGILFTGDAANNVAGLQEPPIHEDRGLLLESLRYLSGLEFEIACFAHGDPIRGGAAAAFRAKWGA
jgi:glyoxylase-like metal-dependent hydrolase (beta-lactamase superfamily II)